CAAARGRFEAVVSLTGENAHAAEAWKGVNAISAAGHALSGIESYDSAAGPGSHDMLGDPALTPTVIRGGDTSNQVPDWCDITVDRRSVPPEEAEEFRQELAVHLLEVVPGPAEVSVALEDRETPFLEAWATDESTAVVRAMAEASGGTVRPFTAATEAAYFAARAPTVVFGPGVLVDDEGPVAHADREYVRLPEVRAAGRAIREGLNTLAASS
ncbi:MAG: peptidase dimerization domain-containing protein, partial [Halobacteriales archaeon]|nr:peptidase dimerization domain-containing protein [Halobacteriales archaeon]